MFDCGVNLCSSQFNNYIETLKEHSINAGIKGWITISNSENEWLANLAYCKKYSDANFTIRTTLGIHPHNAKSATLDTWKKFDSLILNNKIVAIGECGLDYNRMFSPIETQMEVFIAQIELANKYNLPLYLHERDAFDDFYNLLCIYKAKYPNLKGIVHCFTGKKQHLLKYIKLGFYIGITGWICDNKKNGNLVEAIKFLPLDKLILETDSPFLIPYPYGKKRNTRRNQPDSLEYIIENISNIISKTKDEIITKTTKNYKKLFLI